MGHRRERLRGQKNFALPPDFTAQRCPKCYAATAIILLEVGGGRRPTHLALDASKKKMNHLGKTVAPAHRCTHD